MPRYSHSFIVPAGITDVARFHQDSRALKLLTPPPVFVQLHLVQPLTEDSLAEFTMWIGPVPVRWLARHIHVSPQTGFTDIQERGPFKFWQHEHQFIAIEENLTEVRDEISAEPGVGLLNGLISRLMWFNLPILFAYRAWVTRRSILNELKDVSGKPS